MRKTLVLITFLCVQLVSFAQIPVGYYDSAIGLSGDEARTALYNIIDNHSVKSYDNIWGYFNNTDEDSGNVIDIYSSSAYVIVTDQCGQYSAEGDCYNREHSVPQSWFSGDSPMYSDLFHIYPSDGYVNGQRGSFPYGEVGTATYTSTNSSKKGDNTFTGYSGTVFEPTAEYKGDLARTYFYMATRYMDVMSSWSGDNLQGNTLAQWTIDMMVLWHQNDPVSQKEIDRNEAIYSIQNNRNPYIDNPAWVERVFVWPTSINHVESSKTKMWYANNAIYLSDATDNSEEIHIYDTTGKLIDTRAVQLGNSIYQVNLTPGIYIAIYQNRQLKLVIL